MIDAGLPLVQCLEILAANQENPNFQKTLTGVRTTVEGGFDASQCDAPVSSVRRPDHQMIEAGRRAVFLDIILQRLAIYVEKAVKMKAAVKSALIYPVAVVSIAVIIVGALLSGWCLSCEPVRRAGSGLASAYPDRESPQYFRGPLLVVLYRGRSGIYFE